MRTTSAESASIRVPTSGRRDLAAVAWPQHSWTAARGNPRVIAPWHGRSAHPVARGAGIPTDRRPAVRAISSGSTLPMRRSVSRSIRSFDSSCEAGERCCSEQPPHLPKCAQRGSTRSEERSSTCSSSASSWLRSRRRTMYSISSPGSAPATNTVLPARTTPQPSWFRDSTRPVAGVSGGKRAAIGPGTPRDEVRSSPAAGGGPDRSRPPMQRV